MNEIERLQKCLEIFAKKLDSQNQLQKEQIYAVKNLCKTLKEVLEIHKQTNELLVELLGKKAKVPGYIA